MYFDGTEELPKEEPEDMSKVTYTCIRVHMHTGEDCPWCRLLEAAKNVCRDPEDIQLEHDLSAAIKALDPEWEG